MEPSLEDVEIKKKMRCIDRMGRQWYHGRDRIRGHELNRHSTTPYRPSACVANRYIHD